MSELMTHYVPFWRHDDPVSGRGARTICGAEIPEAESTALPSCPQCAAYFQRAMRHVHDVLVEVNES